jgi:hypothetical protein
MMLVCNFYMQEIYVQQHSSKVQNFQTTIDDCQKRELIHANNSTQSPQIINLLGTIAKNNYILVNEWIVVKYYYYQLII